MAIELPALPYPDTALEPYYSSKTIGFHHGKHHKAYVDNLNKLITGTPLEGKSLGEIIMTSAGDAAKTGIFNNSAQVWNHTFFWNCMRAGGGGRPKGDLAARIDAAFGSYEKFAEQFKAAAVGRFGSGWGWLTAEGGSLKIASASSTGRVDVVGGTAKDCLMGQPETRDNYVIGTLELGSTSACVRAATTPLTR